MDGEGQAKPKSRCGLLPVPACGRSRGNPPQFGLCPHLFPELALRGEIRRAQSQWKGRKHAMSMTDPVADMLTRVRNACQAGTAGSTCRVEAEGEIRALLRDNHYVQDSRCWTWRHGLLRLYLKYTTTPRDPGAAARVRAGPAPLRQGAGNPPHQEWASDGDPPTPQGS